MIKGILAALAAIALAGPVSKKAVTKMEWKGQFGGREQGAAVIVEDRAGWEKLWQELGKTAPEADFGKHFAIAVFMGSRNTGGYTVVWEEPKEEKGRTVVRYKIQDPKGMAMQALTLPWAVRLFPAGKKPYSAELKK